MIVGLGTDIIDIRRVEGVLKRTGGGFIRRIMHPSECDDWEALLTNPVSAQAVRLIASRFAAKEAASKALGTGFRDGVSFIDIRIISQSNGRPLIHFFNTSADIAKSLNVSHSHLSLSHEKDYAVATVILESV